MVLKTRKRSKDADYKDLRKFALGARHGGTLYKDINKYSYGKDWKYGNKEYEKKKKPVLSKMESLKPEEPRDEEEEDPASRSIRRKKKAIDSLRREVDRIRSVEMSDYEIKKTIEKLRKARFYGTDSFSRKDANGFGSKDYESIREELEDRINELIDEIDQFDQDEHIKKFDGNKLESIEIRVDSGNNKSKRHINNLYP